MADADAVGRPRSPAPAAAGGATTAMGATAAAPASPAAPAAGGGSAAAAPSYVTATAAAPGEAAGGSGSATKPKKKKTGTTPKKARKDELPEGWEMAYTPTGRPYFIDLRNKRTTVRPCGHPPSGVGRVAHRAVRVLAGVRSHRRSGSTRGTRWPRASRRAGSSSTPRTASRTLWTTTRRPPPGTTRAPPSARTPCRRRRCASGKGALPRHRRTGLRGAAVRLI